MIAARNVRERRLSLPRLLVLAVVGGGGGFAIEMAHLRCGVWSLEGDRALPWWIGGVYFAGLTVAGLVFHEISRHMQNGGQAGPPSRWATADIAMALVLFAAPIVLHPYELAFAGAAWGYLIVRLLLVRARVDFLNGGGETSPISESSRALVGRGFGGTRADFSNGTGEMSPNSQSSQAVSGRGSGEIRADLATVIAAMALDAAVEALLIHCFSLYHYANASLFGLPLWLFPLWGGIGLGLRRMLSLSSVRRQPTKS